VASGGDGNHSGSLPSVGMYLDEQPITTIQGALDIHLYDIARVESLAGPQGTLYGASSQAGTVRIITNKPSAAGFEAGFDVEVNTVAHGGEGYVLEGFVNQPISDNIALRAVGWTSHDAGYIDNVQGTRLYPSSGIVDDNSALAEDDYNDIDTYGARAALRIDLNDSWTVTPSIMGQVEESNGFFGSDDLVGPLAVTHYNPEHAKDQWYQAALLVEGRLGSFDVTYAGAHMERTFESALDYSDYAFFYDTLFGYGAYFTDDAGELINPSQYIIGRDDFTKDSHELRLSSPQDARFRVVGGLFYQNQQHDIFQDYKIDGLGAAISVNGRPGTIWLTSQVREDTDYAVFGEASFDITEQLTVTGGFRAFRSENSLRGFFGYGDGYSSGSGVAGCFADATTPEAPCMNLDKAIEEEDVVPKFNVTYDITDDAMVYATYSEGYRPGGINRRGSLPPYQSDYLKNYEFGWKLTLADGAVRWNGAAYVQEWTNFQFSILGQSGLTEIKNAGQAEVKGVESDVTWVPVEGLTLTASGAYIDSELTENFCGFVNEDGEPETDCPIPEAPDAVR
ncbi:MAG: TonB-dependent receptor, partial [Caulobacteraceae bacterium]